ncbi:hypothetical protein EVJ50_07840 [Synechococcus sp. RSCCF101]|uniref:hypothetical protein n=1 Tax=Synechococcus sp. RSCCF101 TaxID=2511069 RepID=UPI00124901C8|nr:hypothetical protein [Synechococcus sp. RSCCF101]QEY32147.1 hypothetical protein EVJ50_07840 [Synechococcus sp. RSCCF101]
MNRASFLVLAAACSVSLWRPAVAMAPRPPLSDPITGPRSALTKDWIGRQQPGLGIPILILAGHADSQGIAGSGTSGEAVDLLGQAPMDPRMRDELFWNRLVAIRVVQMGRQQGLNIRYYQPPLLRIDNADDPRTNWSVGRRHVRRGGYALEVHFDAYGPDGYGSGLIPRLSPGPNRLDEGLAASFGPFPLRFRGGLGGPRRGISLLEVGKLEGDLERRLRDPRTRESTIDAIALRVVTSMRGSLVSGHDPLAPAPGELSSQRPAARRAPQDPRPSASPAGV